MRHPLTVDQLIEILRELSEQGHGEKPLVRGRPSDICKPPCVEEANYLSTAEFNRGMVVLGFEETDGFQVQGNLPSEDTWY